MALRENIRTTIRGVPRVALGVALAAAGGLVAVQLAAADTPGTVLTVTPSSGLAATDTVTASGTGFSPTGSVTFAECSYSGDTPVSCVPLSESVLTDDAGTFSGVSLTVSREFTATQGTTGPVDCSTATCRVYASDPGGMSDSTPISFVAPPPPADPTLTVTPNSGLSDSQNVSASGAGFSPQGSVTFAECTVTAGGTPISCIPIDGVSVLTDTNGAFGPTSVPVSRTFNATQGVQGPVDCAEAAGGCVLYASDPGGADDQVALSFASTEPPAPPAELTVVPDSNLGESQTVEVSGTNFSPQASVSIFECKLNGGGTQSCVLIGTTLSSNEGTFGPVTVTVNNSFTATQGVTGPTTCLSENDCVVYATDPGGQDDSAPITFAPLVTTTTSTSTTSTTSTSTTSTSTTTTAPPPVNSALCNNLLSSQAHANAVIDFLESIAPLLTPIWEAQRNAANAAYNNLLEQNGCYTNIGFRQQSTARDIATMRKVLPRDLFNTLANPTQAALQARLVPSNTTTSSAPTTYTVVPGDSLSRIAQRLLGSASQWMRLVAANPSIASNPSLIHPGQTLVIPG